MEHNIEVGYLFGFYSKLLTQRAQYLLDLYYNQDFSLAEIAAEEGISRQAVHDSLKRGETELFRFEEILGLGKRYKSTVSILQSVKNEIDAGNIRAAKDAIDELIADWEE